MRLAQITNWLYVSDRESYFYNIVDYHHHNNNIFLKEKRRISLLRLK